MIRQDEIRDLGEKTKNVEFMTPNSPLSSPVEYTLSTGPTQSTAAPPHPKVEDLALARHMEVWASLWISMRRGTKMFATSVTNPDTWASGVLTLDP
jgi:hypothetical protein